MQLHACMTLLCMESFYCWKINSFACQHATNLDFPKWRFFLNVLYDCHSCTRTTLHVYKTSVAEVRLHRTLLKNIQHLDTWNLILQERAHKAHLEGERHACYRLYISSPRLRCIGRGSPPDSPTMGCDVIFIALISHKID